MNELSKMKRVLQKEMPDAPHETLLVIDATTGQNGMSQAKAFKEATDVSGIILTKLDGTSKGGIVLAIRHELGIPIKYIGLGEGVDELYDLYSNLLTEKQKDYFENYYFDDLSISEIAINYNISRNGVYDQLKRVENSLIDYEAKLKLAYKISKIESLDEKEITKDNILSIIKE